MGEQRNRKDFSQTMHGVVEQVAERSERDEVRVVNAAPQRPLRGPTKVVTGEDGITRTIERPLRQTAST